MKINLYNHLALNISDLFNHYFERFNAEFSSGTAIVDNYHWQFDVIKPFGLSFMIVSDYLSDLINCGCDRIFNLVAGLVVMLTSHYLSLFLHFYN